MQRVECHEEQIRQLQPLIIMGMHRSGTSLTVRLLRNLGIFMGSRLSRDAEAIYFQKINRRIYHTVGSKWSNVRAIWDAMYSRIFIQEQTEVVLKTLFPSTFLSYKPGIAAYFGEEIWRTIVKGEMVYWGWKDPRTSFTFPIWINVFPQARFLHIIRNGIDVAISTHRRSQKQRRKLLKRLIQLDYSPLTLDFMYCFQLWEDYITFILEFKENIPTNHYLEIRYEDLLATPVEILRKITEFIGNPIQDQALFAVSEQINRSRLDNTQNAQAYQDIIPSLVSHSLMQQLGYTYSAFPRKVGTENES